MRERFETMLSAHRNEIVSLLSRYVAQGKAILQPHQILDEIEKDDVCRQKLIDGPFGEVLKTSQVLLIIFVVLARSLKCFMIS
ncbi:Glycosyl transferase, family 1 [Artemisia annua]|uniref:Glycosyl transferase, family 1 n=1 Tax=Artemisia annua TaxID=35608 RepID=A0A2U1KC77_ARTAN|nr:Glycosyl transferase, family 1 [Artemisia annua]